MNLTKVMDELECMVENIPQYQFTKAMLSSLGLETSEVKDTIILLLEKAENGEFK